MKTAILQRIPCEFLIHAILVCSLVLVVVEAVECQSENAEEIRKQTESSLVHIERAERSAKEKDYQKALLEYNYILQFYPKSIYATEAQQKIEELTPRIRPKQVEKEQAIISPSRLSFMPTSETLSQGILSIGGGTSVLGEFKAGIYDWLEVGLNSGVLVDVKAKIINESSFIPGIALGAVAPPWDLKIGEVYGVAGKKLGRLHAYAGWSYIAGESAAFAGTKLILSKRSSVLLEYNQPIFFEEDIFDLIGFAHNLNTGMFALRFIFPYSIGVETGIGIYTRPEYRWEEPEPPDYDGRRIKTGEKHEYFLRLQLFWSVWL